MPLADVCRASICTVAAVLLAALCWLSGADREAVSSSHLQKVYLGGESAAQAAFEELAQNKPELALERAQWAVRSAPVDPPSTSALGSSLLALGSPVPAYNAFTVAGSLGWRDIPVQLYWLSQAVAANDVAVVGQRLDAILRLNIDSDAVANSLDLLGRSRAGQEALAALLAENPPWEGRFLVGTSKLEGDDFDGRLAAIDLAAAKGAAVDCDAVGMAANQMILDGRIIEAKDLWRRACNRTGDLYPSDGSFQASPEKKSTSPFDWRLQVQGGLEADVAPAPAPLKGRALRIALSRTVRTLAAQQLTALLPGRYHLSWETSLDNGKPDNSITVLIQCSDSPPLALSDAAGAPSHPNRTAKAFSIPAEGCPIQAIEIRKAASVSGDTEVGWIDSIRIAPLH